MAKQTGINICGVISLAEKKRLIDYCQRNNQTVSTAVREAITHFLDAQESESVSPTERALEQRMRALENRTATLLAKMGRAVAQNMYFTISPFIYGGWPEKPVSQEGMNMMWHKASQFAGMWMKRADAEKEKELIKEQFEQARLDEVHES